MAGCTVKDGCTCGDSACPVRILECYTAEKADIEAQIERLTYRSSELATSTYTIKHNMQKEELWQQFLRREKR